MTAVSYWRLAHSLSSSAITFYILLDRRLLDGYLFAPTSLAIIAEEAVEIPAGGSIGETREAALFGN